VKTGYALDVKSRKSSRAALLPAKLTAEAAGTFFITLVPTVVDIGFFTGHGVDFVSRWLARGFIATAMIYALSGVSGAHLDPAVSLAFAVRRVLEPPLLAAYVTAQFGGAFAAAALAYAIWGPAVALGASHPGPEISPALAFVTEIVLTLLLVLVILATAEEEVKVGKQAAVAVGLTICAAGFSGGWVSGASMNPARSIAPQILGGSYGLVWIYAAGPCLGAILAALLAPLIFGPPNERERKAAKGEGA